MSLETEELEEQRRWLLRMLTQDRDVRTVLEGYAPMPGKITSIDPVLVRPWNEASPLPVHFTAAGYTPAVNDAVEVQRFGGQILVRPVVAT